MSSICFLWWRVTVQILGSAFARMFEFVTTHLGQVLRFRVVLGHF